MQHNQHIADLAPLLLASGIRHAVICPGSRNAPLTQLFTTGKGFRCHSIVDERSAGYVALGMARQLGEPVAVVTTSGTAVLNLAPAVAEAYHQEVPIVVITADRPLEKIGQFNNQWLDQEAPFFASSKGFYQLPLKVSHPEELEHMLGYAGRLLDSSTASPAGPVHLNVPLEEPLYEKLPESSGAWQGSGEGPSGEVPAGEDSLQALFPPDRKIMVLAGMGPPDENRSAGLTYLVANRQAVVVAENIANIPGMDFIAHPELVLALSGEAEMGTLRPDLVISFGGQVVSKRLKLFLQSIPDVEHREISREVAGALSSMKSPESPGEGNENQYLEAWKELENRALTRVRKKRGDLPYGNLSATYAILEKVAPGTVMHLGNSAAIRYSQLVPCRNDLTYYSNRGVSGIDGCLSSAAGAAMVSEGPHLLVVGDLSFVYDSNAMWNKDFPENLKIVVLNDGGGGIFRLLDGPDRMGFFEEFSVTHHPVSLELLSQAFGRPCQRATGMEDLGEKLAAFLMPGNMTTVLEVDTSGSENSRIFKDFLDLNH